MQLSSGGRVFAAGELPHGVGELLAAADIYLESRPLGGLGSSAEAAAHGLPVLSGAATQLERTVFTSGDGYGATSVVGNDAYRAMLGRLIAEPELRHELGENARHEVAAADAAWEPAVEQAFKLARALGPIEPTEMRPLPAPDEQDVLIDWKTSHIGRSPATAATLVSLRALIEAHPELRGLYASLEPKMFRQIGRFPAAFATPPAEADALRGVVAQLRTFSQFGIAERFMIALPPDDADHAIPILEAALEEGPDFDLELTLDPQPGRVQPTGALVLA
jgi:hypothetical protein